MRWTRFLVVVAMGLSIPLVGAGSARADSVQSVVDAGSSAASARGTTAGVAVLDRVTGRYNENGSKAHLRFGSASLVKLLAIRRQKTPSASAGTPKTMRFPHPALILNMR